jgi:site-specific recombinase XerC
LLSLPDPETREGNELVRLTVEEIQQRESRWVIVDILGKGRRRRTVPVPSWVKVWIDDWTTAAGVSEGLIALPIRF